MDSDPHKQAVYANIMQSPGKLYKPYRENIFSLPSNAISFFHEAKQQSECESIQLLPFVGSPSSIIEMKMIGLRWDQSLCLHDLLVVVLPPLVCYVGMKWYRPVVASIM